MEILSGISLQPGSVIAGAAKLTAYAGIATFASERMHDLAENLRRFGGELPEPEQVIVIADEIPPGFWRDVPPGIEIIGAVICSEKAFVPPPNCPTVIGIGNHVLNSFEEGDLVIVEGNRGRVYLHPDATTIARYQAPRQSSKRFFLSGANLPARTASGNREVTVLATVQALAEISLAIEQGADGIYVTEKNEFFGGLHNSNDQTLLLQKISQEIGGLPLYLQIPPDQLAFTALLRAAAETPLHLVVDTLLPTQDFLSEMEMVGSILDEQETRFGRVNLEALIATKDDDTIPDSLDLFDGVVIAEHFEEAEMERLLVSGAQALHYRKPLTVCLTGEGWPDCLSDALAIGSSRLIVSPEYIPHIKDAIRES